MRREFLLPEEDIDSLEASQFTWEAIKSGNQQWVFIHDYPIPGGYNQQAALLALRIDPGYPTSQIDMVYFYPGLFRCDGKPIGALTNLTLDNKSFQRWSRHRTPQNPWRTGIDNLASHLLLINYWLEREFTLR